MKGTDCTPEQLKAAEKFIRELAEETPLDDGGPVLIPWEDLVRLVAWYGAIRYAAGAKGFNSLEKPGPATGSRLQ
jgi:hypothetical protein